MWTESEPGIGGLDAFIQAFESEYGRSGSAEISDHLPPEPHPLRGRVLRELVRVDLEYAWEKGTPKDLREYERAFPDLLTDRDGLREIAFEEERLRRQAEEKGRPGGPAGPGGNGPETRYTAVDSWGPRSSQIGSVDRGSIPPPCHVRRVTGGEGDLSSIGSYHVLFPDPDDHAGSLRGIRIPDLRSAERLARGLSAMPDVGDDFLGFRLIGELGRGAFGRVYLALQGDLAGRTVAVKVSPHSLNEPQSLARLQHTNIVPIYSVHRNEQFQAVCMPFFGSATLRDVCDDLEGHQNLPSSGRDLLGTLKSRMRKDRHSLTAITPEDHKAGGTAVPPPVSPEEEVRPEPGTSTGVLKLIEGLTYVQAVLWMVARLADGLAHAHERGILHGDLKPANILLTSEGQPMLLDFNLSTDLKDSHGATRPVGGTVLYMSPEQLDAFRGGPRTVDARSDLYSFGVVVYELLAGRPPFEIPGGSPADLMDRLLADRLGPPPDLRGWNPSVTPAVESIVRHCLEPDPSRRYQTAREIHEDVERHLANLPLKHAREPSLAERAAKWARRHPTLCSSTTFGLLALVLVASLVAGGWLAAEEQSNASARLRYRTFRDTFERCQLLLNTRGGPPERLGLGVSLAQQAVEDYGVDRPTDWTSTPQVRRLPEGERRELREQMGELVLLLTRASVTLAERTRDRVRIEDALRQGVARLDRAERVSDGAPAALYEDRGAYQAALGHLDLAARDRDRAATITPSSARDFYLLGTTLLARGQVDRAEPLLSRAVALDARRFWAWFALGLCHSDQRRDSDAAHDFSVCTTLTPGFSWSHLNRGLALARAGRLPEARIAYDHAVELDPGFGEARVDRALVCLELGDPAAALADLDRAVGLGHGSPDVVTARAEALSRLGRRAEAELAFSGAIRSAPKSPLPLVARGYSRLSTGRAGSGADFSAALDLDPKNARAHVGRAHLLRKEDPRAARAEVELALQVDPDQGDALELRALIRARLGDPAAENDVDRLLCTPTPTRLYNSACALSLLARSSHEPRLATRSLALLARALESGFPAARLSGDPDLEPLRQLPSFSRLLNPR